MNNVVAIVPIKMNNERLQGKNTKTFTNGEPLIHYILESLLEVKGIDEIYVYCSNPMIKDYLPNGVKYLKRSELLDSKDTLILEVLKSFAMDVKSKYYVLTHATAPFLKGDTIQKALDMVLSGEYDSALSVTELKEFLWKENKPMNFDRSKVQKTQDLDPIYSETTGLYIYSHDLIMNEERRTGDHPYLAVVDKIEATDINEPIDFEIADAIFKEKQRREIIQVIRETRGESYE
ncbi:acylneuraminate cytidylyltransferase family protein [Anaeromicropila herbilytica]|uniref:N-acylneuraminate cytidylyltransferase n=1 Tax=Anaeromicropila herbilytica TaxID=2785025 RepID=A0A7R7EIQ8_9FIRM|nr:acylneuraminate cytidylyltransferase family protein [Anaeromicropila herbilytica]BCN29606.1 N-acylneuraminate cytidylyltransferase [Anaeromicropila herbilytica]